MAYDIPLFDLNFDHQEEQAVLDVFQSKWISTGPKCEELELRFSEMLNIPYSLSLSNCTDALHLACLVLGIESGDEVICPSLTFVASANCIRYVGATPVFCDIVGLNNINIDPKKMVPLINSRTKAIMVVHIAGFPCDMDEIMAIAKEYNLKVIEDSCHGPLSEYKGQKLGTIGDIGCFSFFSNKNISTGEGGMIVTRNEDIYNRLKLLRSHGMTTLSYQRAQGHATKYDVVDLGYNFRMDDIRAAIGVVQLGKLREDLDKRAEVRRWYLEALEGIDELVIPFSDNKEFVTNYIMPVVLKDGNIEIRDRIRDQLGSKGIQTSVHYPAIHLFSIYKHPHAALPITEYVADNEISFPMYGALKKEQVIYIATELKGLL